MTSPTKEHIYAVAAGFLLLAASSLISVPMTPVPITLQTLLVPLLGALYGGRGGTQAVVLWLLAAAAGLPLLSGGRGGLVPFFGPTAGYLYAFPVAAWVTGYLADRLPATGRLFGCFMIMLAANLLCLAGGVSWLAANIGIHTAVMKGLVPFLPGALIKATVAALLVHAWHEKPLFVRIRGNNGRRY